MFNAHVLHFAHGIAKYCSLGLIREVEEFFHDDQSHQSSNVSVCIQKPRDAASFVALSFNDCGPQM